MTASFHVRGGIALLGAGDEASAALKRHIRPEPVEHDRDQVPETDQEIDVHRAPEEPRQAAREAHEAEIGDGGPSSDRGEVPEIAVAKGGGSVAPTDRRDDRAANMPPFLLRHRGDAWK